MVLSPAAGLRDTLLPSLYIYFYRAQEEENGSIPSYRIMKNSAPLYIYIFIELRRRRMVLSTATGLRSTLLPSIYIYLYRVEKEENGSIPSYRIKKYSAPLYIYICIELRRRRMVLSPATG